MTIEESKALRYPVILRFDNRAVTTRTPIIFDVLATSVNCGIVIETSGHWPINHTLTNWNWDELHRCDLWSVVTHTFSIKVTHYNGSPAEVTKEERKITI